MKATGIVRRIDHLGRIVLPIELRRKMEMGTEEPLEFFCRRGDAASEALCSRLHLLRRERRIEGV